ncbi:glycoside hydrolase family 3 protein [Anaerosporobacter faecicola]|uniref:glycoside hydrolase family 3 protein n=1 Tax=Anaerosporobacter faecicola TaxID=2718714 RepID=UPI001439849C|nr:glycoside hydrolase family 3 protein [Anaerosporobacter faecicola]
MQQNTKKEDVHKKNVGRYLIIILVEVLAVGIALLFLGQYKDQNTRKQMLFHGTLGNLAAQSLDEMSVAVSTASAAKSAEELETGEKKSNSKQAEEETEDTEKERAGESTSTAEDGKQATDTSSSDQEEKLTKEEKKQRKEVEDLLKNMTIEEKICQMFIVSPEELTNYFNVTVAKANTKRAINQYHVGGVVYFASNIKSESQLKKLLKNTQTYATQDGGIPMFLGVDEEGGEVARLANHKNISVQQFSYLSNVSSTEEAYSIGNTIGTYLNEFGFNLNFAPDADVLTNKKNTVVKNRSFGSDATTVTDYAKAYTEGLQDEGIYATYKHFPGHGATKEDSHKEFAYIDKTYEELLENEWVPFLDAIEKKMDMIMVGHICVPKIVGHDTPSSLSKVMVTDILREKLGYDGVIITDAMNMAAISNNYSIEESTVAAVVAGCDIILMPADFRKAYKAILKEVKAGEITEERLDESVRRILLLKKQRLDW